MLKKVAWWYYRRMIARSLYYRLSHEWSWNECLKYADCFDGQFEDRWKGGDFSDIEEDVDEDMSCWTE